VLIMLSISKKVNILDVGFSFSIKHRFKNKAFGHVTIYERAKAYLIPYKSYYTLKKSILNEVTKNELYDTIFYIFAAFQSYLKTFIS